MRPARGLRTSSQLYCPISVAPCIRCARFRSPGSSSHRATKLAEETADGAAPIPRDMTISPALPRPAATRPRTAQVSRAPGRPAARLAPPTRPSRKTPSRTAPRRLLPVPSPPLAPGAGALLRYKTHIRPLPHNQRQHRHLQPELLPIFGCDPRDPWHPPHPGTERRSSSGRSNRSR